MVNTGNITPANNLSLFGWIVNYKALGTSGSEQFIVRGNKTAGDLVALQSLSVVVTDSKSSAFSYKGL